MSKAIRFYSALDMARSASTGRVTLESTDGKPISGKATRVTLTTAQTAHLDGILSDGKALAAALKAGTVTVPTGQRGKPRAPRTSIAAIVAAAKTPRTAK